MVFMYVAHSSLSTATFHRGPLRCNYLVYKCFCVSRHSHSPRRAHQRHLQHHRRFRVHLRVSAGLCAPAIPRHARRRQRAHLQRNDVERHGPDMLSCVLHSSRLTMRSSSHDHLREHFQRDGVDRHGLDMISSVRWQRRENI